MRRIDNIGELYGMTYELFVETMCPKCENISISTMPQAEKILIFGCLACGDIEQSMLTEMSVATIEIIPKGAMAECIND